MSAGLAQVRLCLAPGLAHARSRGAGARGSGGQHCRLNAAQVERLEAALDAGPAVGGARVSGGPWPRVTVLVGRLFHVSYTPRGISYLLHRLG
ncbi:hypothetical protein GCM10010176_020140 [Nonomuraea spiralis]|nr:hypothetical protein GCM10010176_020140 [Nonomuraea spiralis]